MSNENNTQKAYNTIGAIHDALTNKEDSATNLFQYILNYKDTIKGSETDFHNLTVEFSRQNSDSFAAAVARFGLQTYPLSPDLLADAIKYSQDIGDIENCQSIINSLDAIDLRYWKWRTFVFVIDYLKDSLAYSKDVEQYMDNLNTAKKFIDEFKKVMPYEERAYVAEAEFYLNQNDYNGAIKVLQQGIESVKVAPQCCLKLADIFLEQGNYEEVEELAKKGILASLQEQPSVSVGYLYYLLALSMDARRIKRRDSKNETDMPGKDIQAIIKAYLTADRLFVNEGRERVSYRKTIRAKLIIIEMEEGVQAKYDLQTSISDDDGNDKQISIDDIKGLISALKTSE